MIDEEKYRRLGFKCGLEIHQQLLTSRKLYCRCPAKYRNDPPDGEIIRHMRPTLSELGEYDGTALMEFKTRKNVTYQLYRENCCTYEMDDTPPFPINPEALEIALKLAMLLNCSLVDELHVSRKQYLDGSIPTGFQRTAIVGVNGWVPYKGRKINITHLCLEEDACREVSDTGHEMVFRTDRLSMPLLEVITGPELMTPVEAMEVDAVIGRVLKASGLVRRGLGSVRQDVNVSVAGGRRVEIKGVPQTWRIAKLTANEADRQAALLEIKEILRVRGLNEKTLSTEIFDIKEIAADFDAPIFNKASSNGWSIKAIKINGFEGILNFPTQEGMTFADELAGRVKVIACLDSMPNIAVSDLPEMAGLNGGIWERISRHCESKQTDAMVITWGSAADVATALDEIIIRLIEATSGVPFETRQPLPDCRTTFERILPGPDRMYPDTDSPPVEIKAAWIDSLRRNLRIPAYELEEKWKSLGVPDAIAFKAVVSSHKDLYDKLISSGTISPEFAWQLVSRIEGKNNKNFTDILLKIYDAYRKKNITREFLVSMTKQMDNLDDGAIDDLVEMNKVVNLKDMPLAGTMTEIIKLTDGQKFRNINDRVNYICGLIKEKVNSRVDGRELREEIARRLSE